MWHVHHHWVQQTNDGGHGRVMSVVNQWQSSVDHTQRPALCIAWWAIGRNAEVVTPVCRCQLILVMFVRMLTMLLMSWPALQWPLQSEWNVPAVARTVPVARRCKDRGLILSPRWRFRRRNDWSERHSDVKWDHRPSQCLYAHCVVITVASSQTCRCAASHSLTAWCISIIVEFFLPFMMMDLFSQPYDTHATCMQTAEGGICCSTSSVFLSVFPIHHILLLYQNISVTA